MLRVRGKTLVSMVQDARFRSRVSGFECWVEGVRFRFQDVVRVIQGGGFWLRGYQR
jgi:hypothetical protein